MTERELKKLDRRELLELLLIQTRRTEELEDKLVAMEQQLSEVKRQLNDRKLAVDNAGSLAEAALKINGVFEAADAAARQYLENLQGCEAYCDQMLEQTKRRCAEMEQRAEAKVSALKAVVDRISQEWGVAASGNEAYETE